MFLCFKRAQLPGKAPVLTIGKWYAPYLLLVILQYPYSGFIHLRLRNHQQDRQGLFIFHLDIFFVREAVRAWDILDRNNFNFFDLVEMPLTGEVKAVILANKFDGAIPCVGPDVEDDAAGIFRSGVFDMRPSPFPGFTRIFHPHGSRQNRSNFKLFHIT